MNLHDMIEPESSVVLFVTTEILVPEGWDVLIKKPLLQMVYLHEHTEHQNVEVASLDKTHVAAMLSLTEVTQPGPFLPRTVEFGGYEGIFEGSKLIAMAGQRLKADPYIEISAVCTHPDYLGNGYARVLLNNQISNILGQSGVPFLHVLPENTAQNLYLKLGFEVRKEMLCYVLRRLPGR